MAFMAAALPWIGTIASVGGSIAGGLYGSAVASNNAKIADYNAQYVKKAAGVEATDRSLKGAQQIGAIKTGYGVHDIDIGSGSAQNVIASQKATTDVDIERILHNADLSAYGYSTQKQNFENEAGFDMLQGITGAASTLAEKAPTLNWKWGGGGKNSWTQARAGVFGN